MDFNIEIPDPAFFKNQCPKCISCKTLLQMKAVSDVVKLILCLKILSQFNPMLTSAINTHLTWWLLTVSLLDFMESELKLFLIKRVIEHCKGLWPLMRGFVSQEESMYEAANRILYDLTGLKHVYLRYNSKNM